MPEDSPAGDANHSRTTHTGACFDDVRITGDKFALRALTVDDAPAIATACQDPVTHTGIVRVIEVAG